MKIKYYKKVAMFKVVLKLFISDDCGMASLGPCSCARVWELFRVLITFH